MSDHIPMWKHVKTGNYYTIVGFAIEERTLTPVVVYQPIEAGVKTMWTRPCHEFFDGRFVQEGRVTT